MSASPKHLLSMSQNLELGGSASHKKKGPMDDTPRQRLSKISEVDTRLSRLETRFSRVD